MNNTINFQTDFAKAVFRQWTGLRTAVDMADDSQIVGLIEECIRRGICTKSAIFRTIGEMAGRHLNSRVGRILREFDYNSELGGPWELMPWGDYELRHCGVVQ